MAKLDENRSPGLIFTKLLVVVRFKILSSEVIQCMAYCVVSSSSSGLHLLIDRYVMYNDGKSAQSLVTTS